MINTYIALTYLQVQPKKKNTYQLVSLLNSKKMERMGSRRLGYSPDTCSEKATVSLRSCINARSNTTMRLRSHKQIPARSIPSSPVRFFRYVKINVVRAIRLVSKRRRPSTKGSSNMIVPQQFVPHRDSHHSEAMEDCIEFVNSSYRKSI